MQPSTIRIRPISGADTPALARLSGELGYPSTPAQVERRLARIYGRSDDAVYVAEVGGEVAGWTHVGLQRTVESEPRAELHGLVVAGELRGRGVGRALVAAAAAWVRERGLATLRVRSNVVRGDAHRFYERQGFRQIKEQVVLDLALDGGPEVLAG